MRLSVPQVGQGSVTGDDMGPYAPHVSRPKTDSIPVPMRATAASERLFEFEAPAHRAFLGGAGQAELIAHFVFDLAVTAHAVEAGDDGADAVLLLGELAGFFEIGEPAVELDAGLEQGIEPQPRLPSGE